MNDRKQRRNFTDDFKTDAVKLVFEHGYDASEAARRLVVDQSNDSRWVRGHRRQVETPSGSQDLDAEVKRLRKENKRLLMERDI